MNGSWIAVSCFVAMGLGGCSSYQADFECGVPRGVPCTSLSAISQMADEGAFDAQKGPTPRVPSCCSGCEEASKTRPFREMAFREARGEITRYEV